MRSIGSVALALLFAVSTANAGTLSLDLTIANTSPMADNARVTIAAHGDTDVSSVSLELRDPNLNIDYWRHSSHTGSFTWLITPDEVNAGLRGPLMINSLTDFGDDDVFTGVVDVDRNVGLVTVPWLYAFADNGDISNPLLTVTWVDGRKTTLELPTFSGTPSSFTVTAFAPIQTAVPEPTSIAMLGCGMAFIGGLRFLHRRSK